jgi:hypothetical protein
MTMVQNIERGLHIHCRHDGKYVSEPPRKAISYAVEFGSSIYAYDLNGRALWSKPKPPYTHLAGYSATSVTVEYNPPGGRKRAVVYDPPWQHH